MTEYAVDLGRGFSVLQDTEGYRFTQDSVICANLLSAGSRDRLLDLGCGVGIIAILALLKKGVLISGPLTENSVAPDSFATASAIRVLPVPGGP